MVIFHRTKSSRAIDAATNINKDTTFIMYRII